MSDTAFPCPATAQQDSATADADPPIQTIIVTGSRIPRPNEQSPSPIQTVQPQAFTITGVANVEETLNQLPQLVPGFTNTSNNPGTGAATLDLRGLGSVRTLILVNGRRWIANDAGAAPEVDVNTIPAALVKRVDVVTGGASAVYGSDAVTGVINFVLDDKLDGLHLEARNNITARGDGRDTSADVSFGTGFLGGRGHVVASAGWLKQEPVLQADRGFSQVTLSDGCVVPGSRNQFGVGTAVDDPQCAPPNELGFVAGGSPFIPGSLIPFTLLPLPGGGPSDLSARDTRFDLDGTPQAFFDGTDLYNYAPSNYLQVGFERKSAILLGSLELSSAFEPYLELTYVDTKSPQQLAPVPAVLGFGLGTVPVAQINLDNPFLTAAAAHILDISFGVDAQGDVGSVESPSGDLSVNPAFDGDADGLIEFPGLLTRLEGLGPRQTLNHRIAKRGLIGVRGELSSRWSYDAYYSQSRVVHSVDYGNGGSALRLQQAILARRDPSGNIVCIDPSNGCVPANVFGPGNFSAEAADFIRTHPRDRTVVEEKVAEASVHGNIPFLRAGELGLAGGLTWRRSSYDFKPDPSLFTGDTLGFDPGTPASGSVSVWELFSEARVPLLADMRFARDLTAELGLRFSRYDSVGSVWTWKALMNWEPVRGLRLRGGMQHAVRAPNIRELFEAPTFNSVFLLDPCSRESIVADRPEVVAACVRNGVPVGAVGRVPLTDFAIASFGGNPNLKAESADSITIGAALKPATVPGLSLSLDYYDIRIKDAIGVLGGGGIFLVSGCIAAGGDPADPLCKTFQRAPDGSILTVDQPSANIPELRARGLDWQAAYGHDLPWGLGAGPDRIDLSMTGTYYFERSSTPNNRIGKLECAGFFGAPCGNTLEFGASPRWKLLDEASYSSGAVTATLRHRWFSKTEDVRNVVKDLVGVKGVTDPAPEGRFLEARHYFDLALTTRIVRQFDFTAGVNNLFDTKPAITGNLQVAANTDPSLYDVLGRRFFVVVKAKLP